MADEAPKKFETSCRCRNRVEFYAYPSDEYHGIFCIDMDRGTVKMVQEGAMVRLDCTCEDCSGIGPTPEFVNDTQEGYFGDMAEEKQTKSIPDLGGESVKREILKNASAHELLDALEILGKRGGGYLPFSVRERLKALSLTDGS